MKNKSKDRDNNFLVMVPSYKTQRAIEEKDDSLMLATIRDDTWNVINMQKHNPKFQKIRFVRRWSWSIV